MKKKRKAIFFDRDGVLIYDPGYIKTKGQIMILPGVIKALKKLKNAGFDFVVVGNQSSVAQGMLTLTQADELNREVTKRFARFGINFLGSYFCPHHPDFTGPCKCRKPQPGLFLRAKRKYSIDMSGSFVMGDKLSDIEAGRKAGCRVGILVKRNFWDWDYGRGDRKLVDFYSENISSAAERILARVDE